MKALRPLFAVAVLLLLTTSAWAAERRQLDLPGGRLGDALIALGRQTGMSFGVSDPALADRQVPPLRGNFTVEHALGQLLRGNSARYVMIDSRTVRIVRTNRQMKVRPERQQVIRGPAPPPPPRMPAQEIIVTAAKRPIAFSSYPGAVTIIDSSESLFQFGPVDSEALASRLPNLSSTHLGPGRNKLFIRGLSDSSFSGSTQATVAQYLGEARLNYNAPDPDLRLYDVERVELLAGPQGTLYGAGSLGGTIRIVPAAPEIDELDAGFSFGVSGTQHGEAGGDAAGFFNFPVADGRMAARVVAYGLTEGGYIDDVGRGINDVNRVWIRGGRASLIGLLEDGWTWKLGVTAQHIRGEDSQYADAGEERLTRRSSVQQDFSNHYVLADATVAKEVNDFRFLNVISLVRHELRERFASSLYDGGSGVFEEDSRATFLSAESRLSRRLAANSGWLVGASLISNEFIQARRHGPPEAPVPLRGARNALAEGAIFGEGRLDLPLGFEGTVGGRIAFAHLKAAVRNPLGSVELSGAAADRTQVVFLPSAAISTNSSRDLLLFLRYQEGFRPGSLTAFDEEVILARSDHVAAVEGGFRYGAPGRGKFDAAGSVVFTRWSDVQADTINFDGRPVTRNIGNGRIYTLDLRFGWRPYPGLSLETAATFNDSLVTDPDGGILIVVESPLPNVARFNGRFGFEYSTSMARSVTLRLSGSATYVGKSILGVGVLLGQPQGGWLDSSLKIRAEKENHAATLAVTNLLDHEGNRFALGSPYTISEHRQITPMRPRTIRIGWETRF